MSIRVVAIDGPAASGKSSTAAAVARLTQAADAQRLAGREVQHVRSALIPADETLFSWFTAPSEAAVLETAAEAGVRFDRVLRTIDLTGRSMYAADPANDAARHHRDGQP